MRVLFKAAAKLREIVLKKRLAASIIRNQSLPVCGGFWMIGSEFSKHARIGSLPEPLNSAKLPGGWPSSRYYAPMMQIAAWISPPWFSWSRASREELAADVILVNKSLEAVGFDLTRRLVLRRATQAEAAARSARYANLQRTYPCASSSFDQSRGLIIEPLVQGRGLAACSDGERATCIAQVFQQLATAPAATVSQEMLRRWKVRAEETGQLLALPMEVHDVVAHQVSILMNQAKRCWIHSDLSGDNIIVKDGAFTAIDLDTVVAGPAFVDVITLAFAEARLRRSDFLDSLLAGAYDEKLAALGCDVTAAGEDAAYTALFVAWLAWCRTSKNFPEPDLGRFMALWASHQSEVDRV